METVRQLPHSDEEEAMVLGTVMRDRGAYDEAAEYLTPDCFYNGLHRAVWRTICQITAKGDRADFPTVFLRMSPGMEERDLHRMSSLGGTACFDIRQHALILRELWIRRQFFAIGTRLANDSCGNEDVYDVFNRAEKEMQGLFADTGSVSGMPELMREMYGVIDRNMNERQDGTLTGFAFLDDRGGFRPSDLVVIAADSSVGKTSLALSMTLNAAQNGARIAFYSLEMNNAQLAARMVAMRSRLPSSRILFGQLLPEEINRVDKAVGTLQKLGVFVDDRTSSNIDTIIGSIRMMKTRYGIAGAVIDYLQILNVNLRSGNEEQYLATAARRLKNLARELGIWIMVLSQLRRDNERQEPSGNRLRGSGQIKEAADTVLLVYRPEMFGPECRYTAPFSDVSTENTAMIIIDKGRNIGTGRFICGFDAATTCFYELMNVPHIKHPDAVPKPSRALDAMGRPLPF